MVTAVIAMGVRGRELGRFWGGLWRFRAGRGFEVATVERAMMAPFEVGGENDSVGGFSVLCGVVLSCALGDALAGFVVSGPRVFWDGSWW